MYKKTLSAFGEPFFQGASTIILVKGAQGPLHSRALKTQTLDATFPGAAFTEKKRLRTEYGFEFPPGKQPSWAGKAAAWAISSSSSQAAPPPKIESVLVPPPPPPSEAARQLNVLMSAALQTKAKPPLPKPINPRPPWRRPDKDEKGAEAGGAQLAL